MKIMAQVLRGLVRDENEEDSAVTVTEELVRVKNPEREPKEIRWQDIQQVWLITTPAAPFAVYTWLALLGRETNCLILQGSRGYDQVYNIVSRYQGFDHSKVMDSMLSESEQNFVLWTKPAIEPSIL